jgi:hypothetical protein
MKKIVSILLLPMVLFSCQKDEFVTPDYLIFGAFQGSCANGCRFVYYLDNTKLLEDKTVKYFSKKDLSLFNTTVSEDKFLLAKDLLLKVPASLTQTNRTLFVDLNAATPDLWYAEIRLKNRVYTWTFDNATGSTPVYLKAFADEMIRTAALIR